MNARAILIKVTVLSLTISDTSCSNGTAGNLSNACNTQPSTNETNINTTGSNIPSNASCDDEKGNKRLGPPPGPPNYDAILSQYGEYVVSKYLYKIVPPIILVIGTFGCLLTIIVLMKPHLRRTSTSVFLIGLACSDLLMLWTGLLRKWIEYVWGEEVRLTSNAGCKIHTFLVYVTMIMSSWMLVAVTLERVISLWFPTKVKMGCTRKTAGIFVGVVVFFTAALTAHILYGFEIYTVQYGQAVFESCEPMRGDYAIFFRQYWSWIDLCAFALLPFLILLVCNISIVAKLAKNKKKRKSLVASTRVKLAKSRGYAMSNITAMLIVVNITFFITQLPTAILLGIQYKVRSENDLPTFEEYAKQELAFSICNLLFYTNAAINFILYFLSGSRFRKETKNVLRCRKEKTRFTGTVLSSINSRKTDSFTANTSIRSGTDSTTGSNGTSE